MREEWLDRELAGALERLELSGSSILVACSGGLDSVSLARLLCAVSAQWRLTVSVGHIDHGLRGAESEADRRSVRDLARNLSVPFHVAEVDPRAHQSGHSSRTRPTLQEAARELRYLALLDLADRSGADCVATAHTANDQAETVLMRMLRGTSPDGLAGIPARSFEGRVVRPILGIERSILEERALREGWTWREDSSNQSDEYARNRLREHWLPGLAADFNPALVRALCRLADAQRADSEWLGEALAGEIRHRLERRGNWLYIAGEDWEGLPRAMALRIARTALESCGVARDITRMHLERIVAFLRRGKRGRVLELPGGVRLERHADQWRMGPVTGRVAEEPAGDAGA
ncbi:tRNA lysidine(34) synthetase TilS [Myxococcota bacterium]|nr:tRNA lysidine(34) synthetase TilS [Myxococcota bacterium]